MQGKERRALRTQVRRVTQFRSQNTYEREGTALTPLIVNPKLQIMIMYCGAAVRSAFVRRCRHSSFSKNLTYTALIQVFFSLQRPTSLYPNSWIKVVVIVIRCPRTNNDLLPPPSLYLPIAQAAGRLNINVRHQRRPPHARRERIAVNKATFSSAPARYTRLRHRKRKTIGRKNSRIFFFLLPSRSRFRMLSLSLSPFRTVVPTNNVHI